MRDTSMISSWRNLYPFLVLALTGYNNQSGVLAASGPDSLTLAWSGDVTAGFSTTFTCTASCVPPCTSTITLQGVSVNGSTLTWTPDGLESTVDLQCKVLNPETGRSFVQQNILDIKNGVSVQPTPQHSLPSLNQPQSLVCQGATKGLPVVWYKDGQKMSSSERTTLLEHNTTLHFDSLLPSDAGFYMCKATMPTLQEKSAFSLGYLLSFDPWNVRISGPDIVSPGRLSTFTCLTSCPINVDCTVKWQFRWGFPIGTFFSVSSNVLRWTPSISGTFQNLTCVAQNAAAGRSAEATKLVAVYGDVISGSDMVQLSGIFTMMLSLGLLFLFDS